MATPKLKLSDFTPELLEELNKKHGEVYKITVENKTVKYDPYAVPAEDDDEIEEGLTCYIRKPLDREINFALTKMPAIFEAGKVIVKNCWLGGDEEILSTDKLFNAAAMKAAELIEVHKSKLKKV